MDGIICISEKDANWMNKQNLKEVITIPFGINADNKTISPIKKNTIFHIGSMDWTSNQEGIRWFVDKVFPIITKKKSGAILHLAGRSMPKSFHDLAEKNIVIDSEVENAKAYMKKHNLIFFVLRLIPAYQIHNHHLKRLLAIRNFFLILFCLFHLHHTAHRDLKRVRSTQHSCPQGLCNPFLYLRN